MAFGPVVVILINAQITLQFKMLLLIKHILYLQSLNTNYVQQKSEDKRNVGRR
jgi:hypothetical protein